MAGSATAAVRAQALEERVARVNPAVGVICRHDPGGIHEGLEIEQKGLRSGIVVGVVRPGELRKTCSAGCERDRCREQRPVGRDHWRLPSRCVLFVPLRLRKRDLYGDADICSAHALRRLPALRMNPVPCLPRQRASRSVFMGDLTRLLQAMKDGDSGAIDQVFELTYRELHHLAHQRLHGASKLTELNTTSLVHECYLRLVHLGQLETRDRTHFIAYAARVMRSIVVDFVRRRLAQRRGGRELHITLATDIPDAATFREQELLRVDEMLQELDRLDPRLVQVVEMRYFAGLTEEQIAESLGLTARTVRRDWEKARLLLFAALQESPPS